MPAGRGITVAPHNPSDVFARRWRLADPKRRIKGCPLRHDYDERGEVRQIACADLKGTLTSCSRCQR